MVSTPISATTGVANVTQTRSVKKTDKVEDIAFDFAQMMNQSLNDLGQQRTPGFSKNASTDMSFGAKQTTAAASVNNVADSKTQNEDKVSKTDKNQTEDNTVTNKADKTDKSDKAEAGQETTDTSKDTNDLREKIKETLGVTDEQIDAALSALQFTLGDLLDSDKLTQFVVQVTGNESTLDLLTDNTLSQGLFELQNFVAQIAEETITDVPAEKEAEPVILTKEADMPVLEEKKEETVSLAKPLVEDEDSKESKTIRNVEQTPDEGNQKTPEVTVTDKRTDSKNHSSEDSGRKEHQTGENNTQVFVSNLGSAVESAMSVAQSQGVDSYTAVSIVNQIVDAARVTLTNQVSTMELMLNPENLGKVALTVSLKEGIVTAQIVAETQNAKEAIESQLIMLKEQLNNQGLKVEAVEVTIASHSFEAGYDQSSGSEAQAQDNKKKGTRTIDLSSLTDEAAEELDEKERITAQMMAEEGNMVNYQA